MYTSLTFPPNLVWGFMCLLFTCLLRSTCQIWQSFLSLSLLILSCIPFSIPFILRVLFLLFNLRSNGSLFRISFYKLELPIISFILFNLLTRISIKIPFTWLSWLWSLIFYVSPDDVSLLRNLVRLLSAVAQGFYRDIHCLGSCGRSRRGSPDSL